MKIKHIPNPFSNADKKSSPIKKFQELENQREQKKKIRLDPVTPDSKKSNIGNKHNNTKLHIYIYTYVS